MASLFKGISLSLWLMQSVVNAQDRTASASSRLQVHIPQSLFVNGGYDHREALFGIPQYGGSISQNVYYPGEEHGTACGEIDIRGGHPIRPMDDAGDMLPYPSPYILMVDRGMCTFVTKVRNAQRSGAAAVIIADNSCLCSSGNDCTSDPGVDCEPREPIMADDGSGSDISIPSFLMFKQDADKLKAELLANHMVQIEMAWSLPAPDNRVEYELWTMPTELVSREFQRTFKSAAVALGKHAYFTPHMYVYDGVRSNCQGPDGENQCYNLCTNSGRYCATDPDNDLDKGISGADVVVESLRRLCIWKKYGEDDGIGMKWWDYINEFMFRCDTPDFFSDENCVSDAFDHAGIDKSIIEKCMSDSGGLSGDVPNSIIDEELMNKENRGVVILPQAYVNNAAIRGALEFGTMFRAVCAGFVTGSEPDVCKNCVSCSEQLECTFEGHCPSNSIKNAVSTPVFAISLFILSGVFFIVGLIQYRNTQNSVRAQVRGIVAEYMPLEEDKQIDTEIS